MVSEFLRMFTRVMLLLFGPYKVYGDVSTSLIVFYSLDFVGILLRRQLGKIPAMAEEDSRMLPKCLHGPSKDQNYSNTTRKTNLINSKVILHPCKHFFT